MKIKLSEMPGCFGAPLVRAQNNPMCERCSHSSPCAKFAYVNDQKMQAQLGVPKFIDRLAKERKVTSEIEQLPGLTKKATEVVSKLTSQGYNANTLRCAIKTPNYSQQIIGNLKPSFIAFAIQTIAHNPRGIFRSDLIRGLVKEYNWTPQTAASHLSIILSTLNHFGLVKVNGDVISRKDDAA